MMPEYSAIVEDLYRCVGCYACEVACRKQNKFSDNQSFVKVRKIGPEFVNGELSMDYIISINRDCTLCLLCVSICPTKALTYCDSAKKLLEQMKKERFHVATLIETTGMDRSP